MEFETYKIVQTDNFDGDYPDEKFVEGLPHFGKKEEAEVVAKAINSTTPENFDRYWKVVKMPYKLVPGFEP